jgi:hypothetical protein
MALHESDSPTAERPAEQELERRDSIRVEAKRQRLRMLLGFQRSGLHPDTLFCSYLRSSTKTEEWS